MGLTYVMPVFEFKHGETKIKLYKVSMELVMSRSLLDEESGKRRIGKKQGRTDSGWKLEEVFIILFYVRVCVSDHQCAWTCGGQQRASDLGNWSCSSWELPRECWALHEQTCS